MGIPLGVSFNNPLNVRPTAAELAKGRSDWQGVLKIEQTGSGAFLHFIDPPKGWRCAAGNVIAHYDRWGHNTIAGLIGGTGTEGQPDYRPGWAPASDHNDPAGYIAQVSAATGFGPNDPLNFHTYGHLKPVLVAMARVEQGEDPYTWWNDAQIDWGLAQYGVLPPPKPMPRGPIIAGGAAAAATAAQAATSIMPAYNPPSTAPTVPQPLPIGPSTPDIGTLQTVWSTIAPYCKGFAIAITIGLAGYMAWRWWHEDQKRRQGLP